MRSPSPGREVAVGERRLLPSPLNGGLGLGERSSKGLYPFPTSKKKRSKGHHMEANRSAVPMGSVERVVNAVIGFSFSQTGSACFHHELGSCGQAR